MTKQHLPLATLITRALTKQNRILVYFFISALMLLSIFIVQRLLSTPAITEQLQPDTNLTAETLSQIQQTSNEPIDIVVKSGDSLAKIFQRLNLNYQILQQLTKAPDSDKTLKKLYPGQKLQILLDAEQQLEQLIYHRSNTESITFTRQGNTFTMRKKKLPLEIFPRYVSAEITHSLYLDAKKANVPEKIIQQLINIFSWQIDLKRHVRAGDKFVILYEDHYAEGKKIDIGHIVAARLTNRGKHYTAIRHTRQNKNADYYTETGESLRSTFLRSPLKFSYISSHFNRHRFHPILRITRPHWGVDYVAPLGTPIKAAGNGLLTHVGKKGNFGNLVEIKHNNRYKTRYAHLLRFPKGLKKGKRVKQGQIIGYVGQSGLASGPHLHYEFRVKGHPVNPLKVKLPRAQSIAAEHLPKFLDTAKQLVAQLELYQQAQLASMS